MQILALAGIMMDGTILFKIKIKVDDFMKVSKDKNTSVKPSASTLVPQELRWRRNILLYLKFISLPCFVVLGDR